MKIKKQKIETKILGVDGGSVELIRDNIGDPFVSGVSIIVESEGEIVSVLMDKQDAKRIATLLNGLCE